MAEPYRYGFMPEPWLSGPGFSIGPFLTNEEDRRAYERAREMERKAQPNRGGLPSLMMPSDREQSLDQFLAPVPQAKPQTSAPFPERLEDWSTMDHMRAPFTEGGEAAYLKAKERQEAERASQLNEADRQATADRRDTEAAPPTPTAGAQGAADAATPAAPPSDIPAQPALSPQQQMIEDIKSQRALVDQLYPSLQYNDASQNEADQYAERERQRANALAQLAFFSGITQGAGGSWEGVGRGFAAAGQAYSEGFNRYQKALQARAERMAQRQELEYEQGVGRTDAALKLYQSQEKAKSDALEKAEERRKDNRSEIYKYFEKRLDTVKGDELNPPDPNKVEGIFRDLRRSLDAGEVVETVDVRDK